MLQTAVKKVHDTGFRVIFTVCDLDPINRSVYKGLGCTKESPSFMVQEEVFFFFNDPQHLLKSIRNNVRKYDIRIGSDVIAGNLLKKFMK